MTAPTKSASSDIRWAMPPLAWIWLSWVAAALGFAFFYGLRDLVQIWQEQEEYSFGFFVPVVAAYLVWQRREILARTAFTGSWLGAAMVAVALALLAFGQVATMGTVVQYAFLLGLAGLVLSYTGTRGFSALALPMLLLVFMLPLPNYLLREMSQALQLWSSQLGVLVIRLFGISVYLEGNVIDLGTMRLQVVEACSGLRYLLPLTTIAFIAATLFQTALWRRLALVLSAAPITLLMNSMRIAMIGILVQFFGKPAAEGFVHDFEGWAVFLLCTVLLIAEMAMLVRIGPGRSSLAETFRFEQPEFGVAGARRRRPLPAAFMAAGALMLAGAAAMQLLPERILVAPERKSFAEFPLRVGTWSGRADRLDPSYLPVLKLDDYLLANYATPDRRLPVNFYVSYYATQANGNGAHSPRACIPGDGWEIVDIRERTVEGVAVAGEPLRVNRALIQKGDERELVYYWFQQRGRVTTNEYLVKFHIFVDAVTRSRTDGAMVRLVVRLEPGDAGEAGDRQLEEFAAAAVPRLSEYVPE